LRGLPVGDYIVYYRENESWVIISRIIHGSREQEAAFSGRAH
jgi:plasmid stabilization system protein ParE